MTMTTDHNTISSNSLVIETDLYGPPRSAFPIQVELGGQAYQFSIWRGEQLPDRLIAYDTETKVIQGNEIPQLALATVYGDQGSGYFVHASALPRFIKQHADHYWCCHNAAFDFWVTAQHLQADTQTFAMWWDIADSSRLLCTMLLDSLIRLAKIDAEPINRDLATVAAEYCPGTKLNKSDPYRLRYGELIGVPSKAWTTIEPGFLTYAAADPIATLRVCKEQARIAAELTEPHRSQLLPDAIVRFGPLTACLQVQGAIALDYLSRIGISVDLDQVKHLQTEIASLVTQHMTELEQLGGTEIFKRYGPRSKQAGQYQLSKSGVARRNAKHVKHRLQQIAQASGVSIRPPRNKDGLVTDSVKYWQQHMNIDPFIAAYVQFQQQAKLMQFFAKLDQRQIYPRYRPLVRTGRTSCSNPNLQQLPRDGRFREMIIAPPGYWLLQIDYSVLELRTLAQICLRRYGHSRLAELFQQGVDPHCYTAALLLDISLAQFEQLPKEEQKQHRQRAKAVGFGVPGGLGAASLVSYAKSAYGVALSIEDAKRFRRRMITEIYPELSVYLRDSQHQTIATNLMTTQAMARQALRKWEQITTAEQIVSGCTETPDGEKYQPSLVQHIWQVMRHLNRNVDLTADLVAQRPSVELMRRCFYRTVPTISGRLRGHVGFSQAANSPFQGLAADGNKLALFRLLHTGYRVCGFVHDEMLVLIPDGANYVEAVTEVQQILADSMQVLTPDIPISTEYLLADRWYKDAPDQPTDERGQLIPYRRGLFKVSDVVNEVNRPGITNTEINGAVPVETESL